MKNSEIPDNLQIEFGIDFSITLIMQCIAFTFFLVAVIVGWFLWSLLLQ